MECVGFPDPEIITKGACEVNLPKDAKFIEFACGTGLVGRALKEKGGFAVNIDGIDGSEKMLERAK